MATGKGSLAVERPERSTLKIVGGIAAIVIPLIVWFSPLGLDPMIPHAIAITTFMVISWMTEIMDHAITGLVGCFLFWALKVAPIDLAFSGFATSTPWFLFGAILFGVMASKSGVARRVAFVILRVVGKSYSRIMLGLIIAAFALTFLVPSGIARLVIMIPVALGLIEAFKVPPSSNIARGLMVVLTYTCALSDKMIIAGAAAITASGLIAEIGGVQVLYIEWFLAYLPSSLLTILAAWWLTLRLFPPETDIVSRGSDYIQKELEEMGPWTALEKRSVALLLFALGLWLTDKWHPSISAPLVGLGVGLAATLPILRLLTGEDLKKVNFLPVFFVAAAVSMGNVLVESKALDVLTNVMFGWMEPFLYNAWTSTMVLYWTAFVYHIFLASEVSMLATSIPLLMNFSKAHGLDPLAMGMIWTFAAGGKIFVYQNAVLIVGYSYGIFRSRDLLKIGIALTIVEALIVFFIVPLYWPLIGI